MIDDIEEFDTGSSNDLKANPDERIGEGKKIPSMKNLTLPQKIIGILVIVIATGFLLGKPLLTDAPSTSGTPEIPTQSDPWDMGDNLAEGDFPVQASQLSGATLDGIDEPSSFNAKPDPIDVEMTFEDPFELGTGSSETTPAGQSKSGESGDLFDKASDTPAPDDVKDDITEIKESISKLTKEVSSLSSSMSSLKSVDKSLRSEIRDLNRRVGSNKVSSAPTVGRPAQVSISGGAQTGSFFDDVELLAIVPGSGNCRVCKGHASIKDSNQTRQLADNDVYRGLLVEIDQNRVFFHMPSGKQSYVLYQSVSDKYRR